VVDGAFGAVGVSAAVGLVVDLLTTAFALGLPLSAIEAGHSTVSGVIAFISSLLLIALQAYCIAVVIFRQSTKKPVSLPTDEGDHHESLLSDADREYVAPPEVQEGEEEEGEAHVDVPPSV
jgi:hypothetical protein